MIAMLCVVCYVGKTFFCKLLDAQKDGNAAPQEVAEVTQQMAHEPTQEVV